MPYKPIEIDRQNFTVIGVNFSFVNNFDATVYAFVTVVFESNQYRWYPTRGSQWLKK